MTDIQLTIVKYLVKITGFYWAIPITVSADA